MIILNKPANYPETLKAAYVLNASSFFQLVFKIVQVALIVKKST